MSSETDFSGRIKRKPRKTETRPCIGCGTLFISVFNRAFCSHECHKQTTNARNSKKRKQRLAREKTMKCAKCGNDFVVITKKGGQTRKYCSHICSRRAAMESFNSRRVVAGECCVEGCCKPIKRVTVSLCEMHYMRWRRNGNMLKQKSNGRYKTRDGYVLLNLPQHPLANMGGAVAEHRSVAYSKYAGICPPCHWCAKDLSWEDAVVDHLNEIKDDNAPDNLVVSCNACNRARGGILPFIRQLNDAKWQMFIDVMGQHINQSKGPSVVGEWGE